ncbi:hypothetical protein [Solitalea lacus]|uniref:hypothetical protein n=1 Tax=Solitalea lacus TaxID=2911172 RepID=UPI001EDB77C5|nr:hypothetical protein [Solitalea lacus]UKJ06230.1 hypothetical protein L2B55_11855 [Solitalea lacus]
METSITRKSVVVMPTYDIQEKEFHLPNGIVLPYLEKENAIISIYPMLAPGNNAFSFFFNGRYPADETDPLPYLERATFNCSLALDNLSVEEMEISTIIRTSTRIQLIHETNEKNLVLTESEFAGHKCTLLIELDATSAGALWLATNGQPSRLWLHITSSIYHSSTRKHFLVESRIVLEDFLQLGAEYTVSKKYFDAAYGNYREIQRKFSGNLQTRNINNTLVAKLENGQIINAAFANLPIKGLPVMSNKLLTQLAFDPLTKLHRIDNWEINVNGKEKIKSYPIVTEVSKDCWINRKQPDEVLIFPEIQVVVPSLQTPASDAPFRFNFRNTGLNDTNGKPVLEGDLTLTLDFTITPALLQSAEATYPGKSTKSLHFEQVNYILEIPYADQQSQSQILQLTTRDVTTTASGQTKLVFRLMNAAIRLCYAAIAMNSGAAPGLSLKVELSFRGYSPVEPKLFQLTNIIGSKIESVAALNVKPVRGVSHMLASKIHANMHLLQPAVALQPVILAQLVEPNVEYKLQTFIRSVSIFVSFPCASFGQFYLEEKDLEITAIGCKEAYKLGEAPIALYTLLEELTTPKYKIYRSTNVPNDFLLVPTRYVIGRQVITNNEKEQYRPTILLYSTIDVVGGTSKWVLDATLQPDIGLEERELIDSALIELTPYPPNLEFLTELVSGTTDVELSMDQLTNTATRTTAFGKNVRLTITTDLSSILILLDMLKHDAITGVFTTTLATGETFSTQLLPSLQNIGGEWEHGHVCIKLATPGQLSISNKTECRLQVTGIRAYLQDGSGFEDLELISEIPPFGEWSGSIPDKSYTRFQANYTVVESPQVDLEQINNYIEDVQCQVIFLTTIDFAKAGLAAIEISYRLHNTTTENALQLTITQTNQEVAIQMPITHFLMERVVDYRVTKLIRNDQTIDAFDQPFLAQDLSTQGNIITIESTVIYN